MVLSRARRGTLISDLPIGSDHVQRCSTISAYKGSTQKITTPGEHVLIVAVIKLLPSFANHNAPVKVRPHLPPSGHRWGLRWGFDHHAINDPASGAKLKIKCHQIHLVTTRNMTESVTQRECVRESMKLSTLSTIDTNK